MGRLFSPRTVVEYVLSAENKMYRIALSADVLGVKVISGDGCFAWNRYNYIGGRLALAEFLSTAFAFLTRKGTNLCSFPCGAATIIGRSEFCSGN